MYAGENQSGSAVVFNPTTLFKVKLSLEEAALQAIMLLNLIFCAPLSVST